jgi:hypothetical protein
MIHRYNQRTVANEYQNGQRTGRLDGLVSHTIQSEVSHQENDSCLTKLYMDIKFIKFAK